MLKGNFQLTFLCELGRISQQYDDQGTAQRWGQHRAKGLTSSKDTPDDFKNLSLHPPEHLQQQQRG